MDHAASQRHEIRLIASAVEAFAQGKGWSDADFRWYYRVNPDVDHIHLLLIVKGLLGRDYHGEYQDFASFLRERLTGEPGLFESIGIALWDFDQLREGGFFAIGPDYRDFREEWASLPANAVR